MTKLFFLLVAIHLSILGMAQKPTYQSTEAYRASAATKEYYIVDKKNDRFLVIKNAPSLGNAAKISIASTAMGILNMEKAQTVTLPRENSYLLGTILFNEVPHLIFGAKEADKRSVYSVPINSKTSDIEGESVRLFDYDDNLHTDARMKTFGAPDNKTFTVLLNEHPSKIKYDQPAKLNGHILSDQFPNNVKHFSTVFPYNNADIDLDHNLPQYPKITAYPPDVLYLEIHIRKTREVPHPNPKNKSTVSKTVSGREVFKLDLTTGQIQTVEVPTRDKVFVNNKVFKTPDGQVMLVGCYRSEDASTDDIKGFYTLLLNEEGEVRKPQYHEIPKEVIYQYEWAGSDTKSKFKDLLFWKYLSPTQLVFTEDDGMVIYANIQLYASRNSSGYLDLDIISMKINKEGRVVWTTKIPKQQEARRKPNTIGAFSAYYKGKHYFIYIDHPKNLTIKEGKPPTTYYDMPKMMYLATIDDKTGQLNRQHFLDFIQNDTPNKYMWFYTKGVKQIAPNEIMMKLTVDLGNDAVLKITLPE